MASTLPQGLLSLAYHAAYDGQTQNDLRSDFFATMAKFGVSATSDDKLCRDAFECLKNANERGSPDDKDIDLFASLLGKSLGSDYKELFKDVW